MQRSTAILMFLALTAAQVNAASAAADTTLSGLPLTVAKRFNRSVAGFPETLSDRTVSVPMRAAKIQLARVSTAGTSGGSAVIESNDVPLTTAKPPVAVGQRAVPVSLSIGRIT